MDHASIYTQFLGIIEIIDAKQAGDSANLAAHATEPCALALVKMRGLYKMYMANFLIEKKTYTEFEYKYILVSV